VNFGRGSLRYYRAALIREYISFEDGLAYEARSETSSEKKRRTHSLVENFTRAHICPF
jgi:hypothetical protein